MAAANRKNLSDSERKRLQKNYPFLIEELDATRLTPRLFSLEVISLDDMETIRLQKHHYGKQGGIIQLMQILFRSGNNPYEGFIESLTKEGYHHVVKRLQSDVQNQSSELEDDSRRIGDLLRKYNTQQQTIIRQQDAINQLNGEVKSLKGEVGCIKQQHKTENRPIPMEKMSEEESFDSDDEDAARKEWLMNWLAEMKAAGVVAMRPVTVVAMFDCDDENPQLFDCDDENPQLFDCDDENPQLFDCDDDIAERLAEIIAERLAEMEAKLIENAEAARLMNGNGWK